MATFEGYERRIDQINPVLAQYGLKSLEEADELLKSKGIDVRSIVLGIQPIAFENAVWAYTLGAAIAVKKNVKTAPLPVLFAKYFFTGNKSAPLVKPFQKGYR